MARSRRASSSAPRRSAAPAPVRPAPPQQQRAVAPAPTQTAVAHPPAPSQGPGLMGQMAATAGGVAIGSAVGHTIGHGITSLFSGGSSSAAETPAPQQQQQPAYAQPAASPYAAHQDPYQSVNACDLDARAFAQCMTNNNHDVNVCQPFLDILKNCQANSS
ncbi:hypothetical protein BJ085DRAFT_868, partial [Dimargaris cristalligena]